MVVPLQRLRAALERPHLCPILIILTMKKLILFSFFMLSSLAMTSCTVDSISDNATVEAKDTGGQGGGLTPPPPPPPKP